MRPAAAGGRGAAGLARGRVAAAGDGAGGGEGGEARGGGLLGAFGGTFALTLANPMTILSFAGIVAALAAEGGAGPGLVLVLGVFAGSTAWWLTLVGGVTLARRALPPGALRLIEAISGAVLLAFGAWALAKARPASPLKRERPPLRAALLRRSKPGGLSRRPAPSGSGSARSLRGPPPHPRPARPAGA
jgi:hypothetical protein